MEFRHGAITIKKGGINDPLMADLCNILDKLPPSRVELLIENIIKAQIEGGKWLDSQG